MKWTLISLFLGLMVFSACKKENTMSKIPKITFQSLTDSIIEGRDTIHLSFKFEDGDADVEGPDSQEVHITKITKDTTEVEFYNFPTIPGSFKDPSKGITGFATIRMLGAFYLVEDTAQTFPDTVRFEVFIKDAKGNQSNTITTSDLLVYPD